MTTNYAPQIARLEQLRRRDFDQRHIVSTTVTVSDPASWGISFIGRYATGYPYSPLILDQNIDDLPRSGRKPSQIKLDAHLYKNFDIAGAQIRAFAKVFNALDVMNENFVFDDTGQIWSREILDQELAKVEAQYERVRQMLGADIVDGDSVPILPPLHQDTTTVSLMDGAAAEVANPIDLWPLQERGFITRSVNDARATHTGLDIAVRANSYIRAAGGGTVRVAGVDEVYGQYVVIDHGAQLESVYGHASRLFVTAGDRVRRAEVIGLTGSTGRSTAPHLHFEIRRAGKAVDPLAFVRQP